MSVGWYRWWVEWKDENNALVGDGKREKIISECSIWW